ncbi:MAG: cell division protein SepF [Actinomycetota bacterium]|nr:MAG: cell division protein SepF [Actinomycetota bacterium]
MAGAMRKMAVYLGLVEDDPDYDGYDDDLDDRRRSNSSDVRVRSTPERADTREQRSVSVAEPRSVRTFRDEASTDRRPAPAPAAPVTGDYRIHTIHPRSYNDARRIGEEYRTNIPVIMNLTEMDDVDAKRIVDFAAGLVFGLHGSIERVTNKVFLLSPANVDVRAEAAAQLAEDGFYNQS